jgi:hypothetical protein
MGQGYPSDWDSRRKEVYERDDYTCQNCGAKGGPKGGAELHAHHVVPKANGGTHEISNLQTVCSECHKAVHGDVTAPTSREKRPSSTSESGSRTSSDNRGLGWWLFVAPIAFCIWLFGLSMKLLVAMFGLSVKIMAYGFGMVLWLSSAIIRLFTLPFRTGNS